MARSNTSRPTPLRRVQVGDVFALPLDDGRWAACRVLTKATGPVRVVVQSLAWLDDALPDDLSDPRLSTPLILTHHSWHGRPYFHWVTDPVPADAVYLGRLSLSQADLALEADSEGSWSTFRLQPRLQWRWDHDREAVLAEDARAQQDQESAEHQQQFAYQPLPATSLHEKRRATPLRGWTGSRESEEVRLARRILRDLMDELIALEDDGDEVTRFDAFCRAVNRFNDTDFIDTLEREEICEELLDLADLVGLTDYDVASWRDW